MCDKVFINENENVVYSSSSRSENDWIQHYTDFQMRYSMFMNQLEKMKVTRFNGSKTWFFLRDEIFNDQIWQNKDKYGFN